MTSASLENRQVLVNLGNRYVVFGGDGPSQFAPDASEVLPRVGNEDSVTEQRITETIRVRGLERVADADEKLADISLQDSSGQKWLIEIKVRERDPNTHELERERARLEKASAKGKALEVWHFNVEDLKLFVEWLDDAQLRTLALKPIDVWEKTAEDIFTRDRVVRRIDDWMRRVQQLYSDVEKWLEDTAEVRCERARTVLISEEMMQKFAVPEREISVLDVILRGEVVLSLVPRGVYIVGARGRIDAITKTGTRWLVDQGDATSAKWMLVDASNRRKLHKFDKSALHSLMVLP